MHRSGAPHRLHSEQGYDSGYDLVFRSIRGLHCTWLRGVDCRGYSPIGLHGHYITLCDGVRPPSGELGVAQHRGWSKADLTDSLVLRGTQIPYSAAVDLVAGLAISQYYFTLPIDESKDGDELMMSSTR
ncbi:hypothetical protein M9H77_16715 [Catharanthus roseus]|uniref:Uncharacterized protein n=1 Tax=Catharanthus roseus TaxID=4058 RepID=A0ACC0B2Q8_CATRO|nr:hypothetical protein M9H77_16715 [Catharanthus roseus]